MSTLGNKEIFAKNLRYYMTIYEKDRNKVCKDLGIKYPTFSEWCNAKKYPRIDKIEKLANYFHIKKSDLIESHTLQDTKADRAISRLFRVLEENNISLEQISAELSIPKEALERYKTGKSVPSAKTLLKICEYLNISVDYLLENFSETNTQTNISNNTVVSNNHLSNINIKHDNKISSHTKELLDVYENLDARKQIQLLSYAFELESKDCQ